MPANVCEELKFFFSIHKQLAHGGGFIKVVITLKEKKKKKNYPVPLKHSIVLLWCYFSHSMLQNTWLILLDPVSLCVLIMVIMAADQ